MTQLVAGQRAVVTGGGTGLPNGLAAVLPFTKVVHGLKKL
jgi:hypothetical protein